MNITDFRNLIRQGDYTGHTGGVFPDNAQFNVVILPREIADDFKEFCRKNSVPCPLVFQSQPGQAYLDEVGEIDIRIDVPMYRIYRRGVLVEEVRSIKEIWQEDWVTFLLGCSFTFEYPLIQEGIDLKHVNLKKNVAMYKTHIDLEPTEFFHGKMVVSMRWIKPQQVERATLITSRYKNFHGGPIQIGDPGRIGIHDLAQPDYGEYIEGDPGDVPVFWGCGVTPQNCLVHAQVPQAITHKPGCMLISDLDNQQVLAMSDQMK